MRPVSLHPALKDCSILSVCPSFLSLIVAALALMFGVSGCAANPPAPPPFDMAKVDQLVPGASSVEEATQLLGTPNSESAYADGSRLLQWIGSHVTRSGSGSAMAVSTVVGGVAVGRSFSSPSRYRAYGWHVAILFDKDGKMVRVTHRSSTST